MNQRYIKINLSIVSERGESQRPKISVAPESNVRVCVVGLIMAMIVPTSVICQAVDYAVDKDLSKANNPIDFVILTVLTVLESFTRCVKTFAYRVFLDKRTGIY